MNFFPSSGKISVIIEDYIYWEFDSVFTVTKMWFKIPVIQRENEDQRTKVNSAIYRGIQMRKYYKDENLEGKSQGARRVSLSRKMKVILKQVDKFCHLFFINFIFFCCSKYNMGQSINQRMIL